MHLEAQWRSQPAVRGVTEERVSKGQGVAGLHKHPRGHRHLKIRHHVGRRPVGQRREVADAEGAAEDRCQRQQLRRRPGQRLDAPDEDCAGCSQTRFRFKRGYPAR